MIEIPSDIKAIMTECFDDLIDLMGVECILTFPGKMTPCENCGLDPVGRKSSNRYKTGGPIPFQVGKCPLCNGEGYRMEVVTETIKMLLAWKPRDYYMVTDTRLPDGAIQSKTYLKYAQQIKNCIEMQVKGNIDMAGHQRFTLASEPTDIHAIIQGRYIVNSWRRAG